MRTCRKHCALDLKYKSTLVYFSVTKICFLHSSLGLRACQNSEFDMLLTKMPRFQTN